LTDHFPEYIEVSGAAKAFYNDVYKLTSWANSDLTLWGYQKRTTGATSFDGNIAFEPMKNETTGLGPVEVDHWYFNSEPLQLDCPNILSDIQYENWTADGGGPNYKYDTIGPNWKINAFTPTPLPTPTPTPTPA
jgi:hypothetical protein